jgi:hypothetical protein
MSHRIGHLTTATHQAEVYKSLLDEKERQVGDLALELVALRAELASVREDAERWRYARTVLADDDIKRAVRECGKGHQPHEEENRLTDAAIDAARKGESDAE